MRRSSGRIDRRTDRAGRAERPRPFRRPTREPQTHAQDRRELLRRLPLPPEAEAPGCLRGVRVVPRGRRRRRREGGDPAGAPERLDAWGGGARRRLRGPPSSPAGIALADALPRFPIPKTAFEGLLAGCRQDLVTSRYATFEELLGYCDLVASTISTISSRSSVASETRTPRRGQELATALQLTNIVRDVGEDVARGRVYLPLEDLDRFGVAGCRPPRAAGDSRPSPRSSATRRGAPSASARPSR